METKTDDQDQDETTGTKPAPVAAATSSSATVVTVGDTPAGDEAPPAELAKSHGPTCEHCDDAAVQTDPPVTSTQPFRKGACVAHQPVEAKPGEEVEKVASPVKRPIEHWATVKGMLPRMLAQGKVEQTGRLVPARQNPKFADFHRARQGKPVGHEMTEAEFDKAVADAKTHAFH